MGSPRYLLLGNIGPSLRYVREDIAWNKSLGVCRTSFEALTGDLLMSYLYPGVPDKNDFLVWWIEDPEEYPDYLLDAWSGRSADRFAEMFSANSSRVDRKEFTDGLFNERHPSVPQGRQSAPPLSKTAPPGPIPKRAPPPMKAPPAKMAAPNVAPSPPPPKTRHRHVPTLAGSAAQPSSCALVPIGPCLRRQNSMSCVPTMSVC